MRVPAILIVAMALAAVAGPAGAHALFQSSQPQPSSILPSSPSTITIHVTERASPGSASIRVTDTSGNAHEQNGTRISSIDAQVISTDVDTLEPGVYTVLWRVTSAEDGHPSAGSFGFCVQDINGTCPGSASLPPPDTGSSTPVSPVDIILRVASYIATAAAVGAAAFAALIWYPSSVTLPESVAAPGRRGMAWLMLWGGGNALGLSAYSAAWLSWSLLETSGTDPGGAVAGSVFLQSLIARVFLAGALGAVLVGAWMVSQRRRGELPPRWVTWVALGLSLPLVGVIAAASHSAALDSARPWGSIADAAHVLFISLWAGGLLSILFVSQSLKGPKNALLAKRALTRFSTYAAVSVAGVVAAGGALSLLQVGGIGNLVGTTFGLIVLTKIGLVVPMVALGAHNHFKSVPHLTDPAKVVAAAARVARNVRWEALLGASVLVASGVLASQVPSVSLSVPASEPQAFFLDQVRDGVDVELQVYPPPGGPGDYILSILLTDSATGALFLSTTNASMTFKLSNSTLPSSKEDMLGPHDNHYFLETTALSQPGDWRVTVTVQRNDGFCCDLVATFHVNIKEAAPPAP